MTLNEKINKRRDNYFGRWAKARRLFNAVIEACNAGKTVYFTTYGRSLAIKKKHLDAIKVGVDGLYARRGKSWDFLGGCKITIG